MKQCFLSEFVLVSNRGEWSFHYVPGHLIAERENAPEREVLIFEEPINWKVMEYKFQGILAFFSELFVKEYGEIAFRDELMTSLRRSKSFKDIYTNMVF